MTNYTLDKQYNYPNYPNEPNMLPLADLIIDERIAEMIEQNNLVFPQELNNNLYDQGTVSLNQLRLNNILEGYKNGLPPIEVKYNSFNGKYEVLNGRHRLCAAIMHNSKYIYSLLVTNLADLMDDDIPDLIDDNGMIIT